MNSENTMSTSAPVSGATSRAVRTPLEVVQAYTGEFWNKQNFEIADEIIADKMTRHVIGAPPATLTRAQAKERGYGLANEIPQWKFRLIHAIADGEMVCAVYDAIGTKADGSPSRLGSIEVFQVVEGKIVAVWNNSIQNGLWDES